MPPWWMPLFLAIPMAMAVLPFIGYARTQRLQGFARDPRLTALGWFFLLYGIASVVQSGGGFVMFVGQAPEPSGGFNGTDNASLWDARGPGESDDVERTWRFEDRLTEPVTLFWPFWLHHALVLAALAIVAYAYVRPAREQALGMALLPVLFLANAMLQAIEAVLALVPTIMVFLNWRERRTRGSLQVAIGFALLALAHLAFAGLVLVRPPLVVPLFDIVALAGVATLVFAVPSLPRET